MQTPFPKHSNSHKAAPRGLSTPESPHSAEEPTQDGEKHPDFSSLAALICWHSETESLNELQILCFFKKKPKILAVQIPNFDVKIST